MKRTIVISLTAPTLGKKLSLARAYLRILWFVLVRGKAEYSVDTQEDAKPALAAARTLNDWLRNYVSMDTCGPRSKWYRCQ